MNYQVKNSFSYNTQEMREMLDKLFYENKISSKRSKKSYEKEWIAHNWLYKHGLFTSHTKDVDLNEDEKLHRLLAYELIYLIAKEK